MILPLSSYLNSGGLRSPGEVTMVSLLAFSPWRFLQAEKVIIRDERTTKTEKKIPMHCRKVWLGKFTKGKATNLNRRTA